MPAFARISSKFLLLFATFSAAFIGLPAKAQNLVGDADGNGVVELEDARVIARYLTHQIPAIPNPYNADVNQDGVIDMQDAFAIAQRVTGNTAFVVVAPRYGSSNRLKPGSRIRIQVFEKFGPFNVSGATVRIQSSKAGFDSGSQPMTFERDGKSLYLDWNTTGLPVANDYNVGVTLTEQPATTNYFRNPLPPGVPLQPGTNSFRLPNPLPPPVPIQLTPVMIGLTTNVYEPPILAQVVDAYCPTPGIPLVFRRTVPHNSAYYPYLGPFGYGWVHSYDLSLEEYTDGTVAFHGPEGFNRFFTPVAGGTYNSGPGDYGVLTRDPDGTFQIREKTGLIYRFLTNLKLDSIQDLHGNTISMTYDGSGNLVKIQHSCGKYFTLQYNANGNISSLTDHAGRVTTYEYMPTLAAGLVQVSGYAPPPLLLKATDPLGNATQYTYLTGQSGTLNFTLNSVTYPDGTIDQFTFDSLGRLVTKTGAWGAQPVSYAYVSNGTAIGDGVGASTLMQVNQFQDVVAVQDSDGGVTFNNYDEARNLLQQIDPRGNTNAFAYNAYGDVVQSMDPLGNTTQIGYNLSFHKPSYIIDALGKTNLFQYDSAGNLLQLQHPDGTSDKFTYDADGNRLTATDALGNTTGSGYNSQGQLTARTNALGNVLTCAYTSAGDLSSVVNPRGYGISMTRDTLGRLTRRTYPDGSHEDYAYNGRGKCVSFSNRRGQQITYSYNVTGQLATKTFPSGKSYIFSYDARGVLDNVMVQTNGVQGLDVAYEHDLARRLTKVKVPGQFAPQTYDISYAYDANGNRTLMVYPDGYTLHYQYDAANRLVRVSDATNKTLVTYEYDAIGNRVKRTLGNGTYTTYQYDLNDRVTLVQNESPSGTTQTSFAYERNVVGAPVQSVTRDGTNRYMYDSILQLTNVVYSSGDAAHYSFDANGSRVNVVSNGVQTQYIANALDQYTQVGNSTVGYDVAGNITTNSLNGTPTIYTWDEENHMLTVTRQNATTSLAYDYDGRLTSKGEGTNHIRFIWSDHHVIAELDAYGNVLQRFIYGEKNRDLVLIQASRSNYWAQGNSIGSLVATTDDGGNLVEESTCDIYGNTVKGGFTQVPQIYAGMQWDPDVKLYLSTERWFDPALGRFISADPASILGGVNLYTYALNSPVFYLDPLGLRSWQETLQKIGVNFGLNLAGGLLVSGNLAALELIGFTVAPVVVIALNAAVAVGASYIATTSSGEQYSPGQAMEDAAVSVATSGIGEAAGEAAGSAGVVVKPTVDSTVGAVVDGAQSLSGVDLSFVASQIIAEAFGLCPTFVQPPDEVPAEKTIRTSEKNGLNGELLFPRAKSMLRSDIPIFGIAAGKSFKSYHVEVGAGTNPVHWEQIAFSTNQEEVPAEAMATIPSMQGDLDLRGNLATWNTGLKEWVHLPWHPPEDKTDYQGVYTIRLVVEGKDGQTAEDRVTCEVGNVIAQCRPGAAASRDRRVTMRFPEQCLLEPYRIYSILPMDEAGEQTPPSPTGARLLGKVYRIREPGDRFIKDVVLEFTADASLLNESAAGKIGIAQYNPENNSWIWLPTKRDSAKPVFSTKLTRLPAQKAIYALMADDTTERSSIALATPAAKPIAAAKPGLLVDDSFKTDWGTFKPRDRWVGAKLSRDNQATPDGSWCLKLVNENFGGNFSSTVLDRPFDVRRYPIMSFDYRIPPGVKVDFLLRVNGRWQNLRFTGDTVDFQNKDVNIANLGRVEGVIADDKWHSASVDLLRLLQEKTRITQVDEIVMADWHVGGYMKLEFGSNPRNATYYLNNFRIQGSGKVEEVPQSLLVDRFDELKPLNALGGKSGFYCNPGAKWFEVALTDVPPSQETSQPHAATTRRALQMAWDMRQVDAYGGFWTSLQHRNLAAYRTMRFRLKCAGAVPPLELGLRTVAGAEDKVLVAPYGSEPDRDGWRQFEVPLRALAGLPGLDAVDVLFFSADRKIESGKSSVLIDEISLEQTERGLIDNFADLSTEAFERQCTAHQTGAAAISTSLQADARGGTVCRVSYGGSIGKDYGSKGGFSYAYWQCALHGIDARPFEYLSFRIRGEKGGETPNYYLSDGCKRVCLRASEVKPISTEWQEMRLPLSFFKERGVDLSHLESLQLTFEWKEQSGTVYLDQIRFGRDSQSLAFGNNAQNP